ncbi:unnamed protein product [Rhodiola kirilowii]
MRFKKGTSVEVLNNSGGPVGSWICGEVVNGNGRHYTIRYCSDVCHRSQAIRGRVARNYMRPAPPVIDVKRWTPGDIVEVRCDISWKLALVLQPIDKDNYLVKFMGYSQDLKVHKCDIRPRLVWQDENWVIIGKGRQVVRSNLEGDDDAGDDTFAVQNKNNSLLSGYVLSNTLKRVSPYRSSLIGNARKKLKIRTDGKHKRAFPTQQAENGGYITYPPLSCVEKVMPSSFNAAMPASHNFHTETPNSFECPVTRTHELNDSHSVASSVGSCSGRRGNGLLSPDTASPSSDADSLCSGGDYDGLFNSSPDEALAAERYRSELHEYRKTLEAFRSSGSICWDKEALLTDLRISLHISVDDHLDELTRLSSIPMVQDVS